MSPRIQKWIQVSLVVLLAAGMGLFWFLQQPGWKLLRRDPFPQHQYGSTDFVTWKDTRAGVVAMDLHPVARANENLQGRYIQPGDVLLKIDYRPVPRAEVVQQLVYTAPVERVFVFTVRRQGYSQPLNLLIKPAFLPRLSYFANAPWWQLFPWLVTIGALMSLLSFLILFPVLRQEWKDNWQIAALLASGFLLFGLLLLRYLALLLATEYTLSSWETTSTFVCLALMAVTAVLYLWSKLEGWQQLVLIAPVLLSAGLLAKGAPELFHGDFYYFSPLLTAGIIFVFSFSSLCGMLLSLSAGWGQLSRLDLAFHVGGTALFGILSAFSFLHPEGMGQGFQFVALCSLLIPVLNAAASRLKFGKVSLVLGRSLQYGLFAILSLVLYFVIHQTLGYLGLNYRYQPFIEVSLLILVLLGGWALYSAYEPRLRAYFTFAIDRKKEAFQQFVSRIPTYTSSRQLCEDVVSQTSAYFGGSQAWLWMSGDESVNGNPPFNPAALEALWPHLKTVQDQWALNPQLPSTDLSTEIHEQLRAWGVQLAFPLAVKENYYGLFLLGARRRGVYNLDDLEQLSRLTQQTRLTLGVLHLLEQERMLMEKNYEANLTALRSQINPHFLFNTLNTISSLIHDAPDEAEKATEKLAFIFRYTLKHSDRNLVTLKEELSLVRTYLEIEQLRFGARLEVKITVDPAMESLEIPAFVIQTVVENCIKHGIAKIIGRGWVHISASRDGQMARLVIEDNGPGIDLNKVKSSTGLNNILSRLEKVYERKNLLNFENTGNGTRVSLSIPMD